MKEFQKDFPAQIVDFQLELIAKKDAQPHAMSAIKKPKQSGDRKPD